MTSFLDDPLNLIDRAVITTDPAWRVASQDKLPEWLSVIEAALASDDHKMRAERLSAVGRQMTWFQLPAPVKYVRRMAEAYGKIVGSGCGGRQPAEKGILTSLVLSADESLVGFFAGLFDIAIERDQFSALRKGYAAAGLALLVRIRRSQAALKALLQALLHDNGDAAGFAARALPVIYRPAYPDQVTRTTRARKIAVAPPAEVFHHLTECAHRNGSFLVRFQARRALQLLGAEAPLDNPQGAYEFRMSVEGVSGFSAQLLLPSSASLESLLWLSLRAMGWDNDHLYSFFFSGKRRDVTTEYPSDHDESSHEEPGINVGQVGLAPGVKFICLYDFGDCHVFKYTCQKVIPVCAGPCHASVVKLSGHAPEQYPSW